MITAGLAAVLIPTGGVAVLSGLVDLPALDCGARSADCLGVRDQIAENGEPSECLAASVRRVSDMVLAYVVGAAEAGWTRDGAASALYLTRSMADGRCQRLTVAGIWGRRRNPRPRPHDPGFVLISLAADIRCRSPRPAQ